MRGLLAVIGLTIAGVLFASDSVMTTNMKSG